MNKSSMSALNKISVEMDRLSQIMNQQQIFQKQLQSQLHLDEQKSDSSSSNIDNIDMYFKQYDNPTAKSIPFGAEQELQSQFLDGDSQTINIINRNKDAQQSDEGDKESLHDDKSTVILANLKSETSKEIRQDPCKAVDKASAISPIYENNKSSSNKHDHCKKRINNVSERPGISSIPPEMYTSPQHQKKINDCQNNSSHTKHQANVGSPLVTQSKRKKKIQEVQHLMSPIAEEQKGKLSKISKINRQQLNRLQERKHLKKQISTNRKKTKRETVNSKSTIILNNPKTIVNSHLVSVKTSNSMAYKTSSLKKNDDLAKKSTQKIGKSQQEWQQVVQKVNKLNKINISKYHDNIKKTHIMKPLMKETKHKAADRLKDKKINTIEEKHKNTELKLNFKDQHETSMQILIDEKHLTNEYTKQTQKYMQIAAKMSKEYFQIAMKQCRETSEEAIFKIKLVTLLLYFFDQFTATPLISNAKSVDRSSEQFYTSVAEEEIIEVLLHPKKIMSLITNLPHILMSQNLIAAERSQVFDQKFSQINDQLEQQLEFFLIKKTTLFMYIYCLREYIGFLITNELISQTKRSKVAVGDSNKKMQGFYSNRSKRDGDKKGLKKDRPQQCGLRCDSDRKIPRYDDQLCQKYLKITVSPKFSREQSHKKFYK